MLYRDNLEEAFYRQVVSLLEKEHKTQAHSQGTFPSENGKGGKTGDSGDTNTQKRNKQINRFQEETVGLLRHFCSICNRNLSA